MILKIKPFIIYQNLLKMNSRLSQLEKKVKKLKEQQTSNEVIVRDLNYSYLRYFFVFITWTFIYNILYNKQ